jgi:mono/diheme cytochrome c family protein
MHDRAKRNQAVGLLFAVAVLAGPSSVLSIVRAQGAAPSAQTPAASQPRPGVGPADRPVPDPAAADRGRRVWNTECITCHGAQAHGTDTAPSLLRSPLVLHDRGGNLVGPFLRKGHPTQSGAPSASLTDAQIVDVMNFLRQKINDTLRGAALFTVQDIVTGDPQAGAAYFNGEGKCTTCHSVTGDLAGIAARFSPVDLQQRMMFPIPARAGGGGRAGALGPAPGASRSVTTVTVTSSSGPELSGALVQLDDFYVTLRDASGTTRVVKRTPDMKVVVTDPLQAHHELLDRIADKNIHDLLAFLETLK